MKYSYHLAWGLDGTNLPIEQVIVISPGGETGLLGMLAKECGIGTVIYNDINDEWTRDVKTNNSKGYFNCKR